jgi:hypothetical protein
MKPFTDIFSTPPQAVNEIGTKFWLDRSSSAYAKSKGLDDVIVLFAEDNKGKRARLITQNQELLFESKELDAIVAHIDIMALAK